MLNSCTLVRNNTKLLKNWKFTYFEGHTVLRDEFDIENFFIEKYGLSAFTVNAVSDVLIRFLYDFLQLYL